MKTKGTWERYSKFLLQTLLLANINQLEDKEEEESLLSSNLPLSSDKNYMKLSVDDEQDMLEEMDKEMGELDIKPESPRVSYMIWGVHKDIQSDVSPSYKWAEIKKMSKSG